MQTKDDLCRAEEAGWTELCGLLRDFDDLTVDQPGYTEAWSVKDLMAHIGGWQAETVQILEQIRNDTYERFEYDVDELNARFLSANRDQPASVVRAEMTAARNRMLEEFGRLSTLTPVAEEWFRESGPAHYDEHIPRLRQWLDELHGHHAQAGEHA